MILVILKKKHIKYFAFLLLLTATLFILSQGVILRAFSGFEQDIAQFVGDLIENRNQALLDSNFDLLQKFYNRKTTLGLYAYDHQVKKINYLRDWAEKQGIIFTNIHSNVEVRSVKEKGNGFSINCSVFTTYSYAYVDALDVINKFKMGTYHSIDINGSTENLLIEREWYTDPFADSMNADTSKNENLTQVILSGKPKDLSNLIERRKNALTYADKYCGLSDDPSDKFEYNKKYKNYNYSGGDCANFASQMLYEGGQFKMNPTWGYYGEGSKAWVNANALADYLIYSKRASLVAQGSYSKILKASYNLQPGDIIAYCKKGKVAHVSIVTGADSKGYILVNCHNADRYRVPWDLGWSDSGITFKLIHVHY